MPREGGRGRSLFTTPRCALFPAATGYVSVKGSAIAVRPISRRRTGRGKRGSRSAGLHKTSFGQADKSMIRNYQMIVDWNAYNFSCLDELACYADVFT